MISGNRQKLLVSFLTFALFLFSGFSYAQDHTEKEAEGKFNPGDLIIEHVSDNHSYHLFDYKGEAVAIPLPVIVYSEPQGLSVFSSARFEHGHASYEGYKLEDNKIVKVKEDNTIDEEAKVYDFSMTRNVVQMLLALFVLTWILISAANKYRKNGVSKAPSGMQNAIEVVVVFIRDEVAKVNLGHAYKKYMPYLLTVFFFILINNIFGLIPGTANVTGNIAFTCVLAVISLIVILFSTNGHFWGHIFWPPGVPFLVKFILIPVEFAGIFIKPIALMIRLFANMIAGHIVITCFIMLIFIFGGMSKVAGIGFSPVSILFTVFIYFIEILVAFNQAFIFTNLTAVFIGQAREGNHEDTAAGHDDPVII